MDERYPEPPDAETTGSAPDDGLFDESGGFDETAVKTAAYDVLERWNRHGSFDAITGRIRWLAGASIVVAVLGYLLDFGGIAGLVLQAWWLASLPVAVVASALYTTLTDPAAARDAWWNERFLATLGLVCLAVLARAATRNPWGRVAWQLLFAEDSPVGVDYGYDAAGVDAVDDDQVRRFRRYVSYALWGSAAVAVLDVALRLTDGDDATVLADLVGALLGGASGGGGGGVDVPAMPAIVPSTPLEWALAVALALVVGAVVGVFVAIRRDL